MARAKKVPTQAERHRRRERRAVARFLRSMQYALPRQFFADDRAANALRWAAEEWATAIESKRHL